MKVGDYARTCYGTIFKIENITEIDVDGEYFKSKLKKNSVIKDLPNFMYAEGEILNKTSPNIIDLIEVGDYVNGTKVTMIAGTRYDKNDLHCYCDYCENKETRKWLMIPAKEIKSIVTKEMYSSVEYRVENN